MREEAESTYLRVSQLCHSVVTKAPNNGTYLSQLCHKLSTGIINNSPFTRNHCPFSLSIVSKGCDLNLFYIFIYSFKYLILFLLSSWTALLEMMLRGIVGGPLRLFALLLSPLTIPRRYFACTKSV